MIKSFCVILSSQGSNKGIGTVAAHVYKEVLVPSGPSMQSILLTGGLEQERINGPEGLDVSFPTTPGVLRIGVTLVEGSVCWNIP
jgi:hypothetical protein